jgi:hypothetical protein
MKDFLISFLTPATLITFIPLVVRFIQRYTQLLDRVSEVEKDLREEINARVASSKFSSEKLDHLWGEILQIKQDLIKTETALNNHAGTEGHPTEIKNVRELEERINRLKFLCLQMNEQFSKATNTLPIDPSKNTLS